MKKMQVGITAIMALITSWLGVLAIPVYILVACNVIDYITGLAAAGNRTGLISSYKSIRGITKKVCMWLLVIVGALVDELIKYAVQRAGIEFNIQFLVAIIVAIWLVINEVISILENMIDIGVQMPPFLMPLVKYIKQQVEDAATFDNTSNYDNPGGNSN